jgi:hypothetical protein
MKRASIERILVTATALAALLLWLRREFLWEQHVNAAVGVASGFDVYRSTAVYHTPWVRMGLPLVINAAFIWMPWLIGNLVSSAAMLWVAAIYVRWAMDAISVRAKLAAGDTRLHFPAWDFWAPKWHDALVLILIVVLLIWELSILASRFRTRISNAP